MNENNSTFVCSKCGNLVQGTSVCPFCNTSSSAVATTNVDNTNVTVQINNTTPVVNPNVIPNMNNITSTNNQNIMTNMPKVKQPKKVSGVVVLCVLVLMYAIYFIFTTMSISEVYENDNSSSSSNILTSNNEIVFDKVVYQTDDLIVKQVKIVKVDKAVKFYFSLETANKDNYSFDTYNTIRINGCIFEGLKFELLEDTNNVYLYSFTIQSDNLDKYNINEISIIDFELYNRGLSEYKKLNFEINSDMTNDVIKGIGLKDSDLIYSNEYFNVYFDHDFGNGSGDIYFQSKVSNNYYLKLSNIDFDTRRNAITGFGDNLFGIKLYDYSISKYYFSFHPCETNFGYMKFDYVISDYKQNKIISNHVEVDFGEPKIDTRFCMVK